jgi:predicted LPLAT superfamily acyltransferase
MVDQNLPNSDFPHWSQTKESGTVRGILFLLWLHKYCGRSVFNGAMYIVITYFFSFKPLARAASLDFLQTHARAYPEFWNHTPGYRDVFAHMYSFGQSILDKLLAWSTPLTENEFEIENEQVLTEFLVKENGQLIIGSHLGNLEYCRGFMQRYKQRTINALVYDRHSANFVNAMQSLNPESRMNVYQVDALDIALILKLKTKLEAGEWLFIAGDRIPLSGKERTVTVEFLGRPAQLPIGPYMLAKVLQCEVQLMFSYRKNGKVFFELVPFAEQVVIARKDGGASINAYAQHYASELEKQAAKAPLQWFNFYPYWAEPAQSTTKATETSSANLHEQNL